VDYSGDPITTAFNPAFLLEGLGAIEDPVARLLFTTPTKPAVIRPAGAAASAGGSNYTYLIMPVRLPG
jgi:DNA polymerase-3 subunit beta